MAPTAAIYVLLGLPPLHMIIKMEAQAGICRIMCSQQLKPKSTNVGHSKKCWGIEHEFILHIGTG
jgi:hypothetical protein